MSSSLLASAVLSLFFFNTLHADAVTGLTLYEFVEPHMGTLFRIKLYCGDSQLAQRCSRAAFTRIAQLDNMLSDYKAESELNVATKAAASGPVPISDDLATILKASQKLSASTDGAFDITVGPLTKLWRIARNDGKLPSSEALRAAREKCGYRKLHLDELLQTLRVDVHGMQLDLGAIAKGYAADEALSVLSRSGIGSALVAASGDLAFSEPPPGQPGWKIGVDSLDRADKPFTHVLFLRNAAVSTSGGTEQFTQVGDQRFSHIIDPKTGMGLQREIAVTTISTHGIMADPAATAVSVLGCEKGLAFIEAQPDLAAFILEQIDGRLKAIESSRFKTFEKASASKDWRTNN